MTAAGRVEPRTWEIGTDVEAYHPMRHRNHEWEPATVTDQYGHYVKVCWADETTSSTYHLNVREPGEPDPVKALYADVTSLESSLDPSSDRTEAEPT